VLGAVDGEEITLMLDNHAGTKLCGFHAAAHRFARPRNGRKLPIEIGIGSEIPDDGPMERRVE
jgi:hypothetical protein